MVRVAVVGCGYWGPNLVRNFFTLDKCTLALICDADPARLAPIQRLYPGVKTTTRFEDVLGDPDIDAVALATPVRTHHVLGRQVLNHGKHLLVEKPLALSSQECEDLISLADKRRLVLMVGHTFLYSPALLKVKELSQPDQIGDIFYLYTQRVNLGRVQPDINALWSIAPHDISIALHLMDDSPVEVSARGSCYVNDSVEDVVFITLMFRQKQMAHIHVSWVDPSKVRKVTVVGSKRMIVYDDVADEAKVKVYDKRVLKEGGKTFGEFHYRLHSGDIFAPRLQMTEPLANECAHFVECIEQGKQPRSDGMNGLEVVRVLEAAQQSLDRGGVSVPMRPRRLMVA